MADEKKFVNLAALDHYDNKIKGVISAGDQAAKDYADSLASNYEVAGAAATAQAAAEATAKAYTDAEVAKANAAAAAADTKAAQGVSDAAAAKAAADAAQGEVDALEALVGELPSGITATTVVGYVQEKTSGIASEGAMTELSGRVSTVEGKVATIEGDYLKAADKTELEGKITAEADARAAADTALDERLVEVEAFFKLAEGEQLDTALDTLVEIQTYLDTEGAAADQMVLDIAANADAIEAIEKDYLKAADKKELTDADAAIIERLEAVETELGDGEGSVADQIADAVAAEKQRAEGAEATLDGKIAANAAAAKAADDKAVAAQGEVDALELVVAEKAAQADLDAVEEDVAELQGKVTTLEGASHSHENKTVLDGITADLIAAWNGAVEKQHEHSNKTVLDGITATKVAAWDAAETNAKSYADGLVAEFTPVTTAEIDSLFA